MVIIFFLLKPPIWRGFFLFAYTIIRAYNKGMNYAQWVYDFGIINRAEKNGVSPIVQVIFEFPRKGKVFKTTQEAAWEWRRNKLPSSSSAEYIENLKTRLEFEKINGEL